MNFCISSFFIKSFCVAIKYSISIVMDSSFHVYIFILHKTLHKSDYRTLKSKNPAKNFARIGFQTHARITKRALNKRVFVAFLKINAQTTFSGNDGLSFENLFRNINELSLCSIGNVLSSYHRIHFKGWQTNFKQKQILLLRQV